MPVFGIQRYLILVGMALRSHECPQCENVQTDIVPSAQERLDPAEDNPVNPTFLLSVSEGFDDEIVDIFGSAFERRGNRYWCRIAALPTNLTSLPRANFLLNGFWCWVSREREIAISLSEKALAFFAELNPEGRVTPYIAEVSDWSAFPAPNRRAFAELTVATRLNVRSEEIIG